MTTQELIHAAALLIETSWDMKLVAADLGCFIQSVAS